MRHAGTFQIPTYAIPMLEYGDTTGVDWTGIEQPYFASHPEFGIAAEVVEADFYHA